MKQSPKIKTKSPNLTRSAEDERSWALYGLLLNFISADIALMRASPPPEGLPNPKLVRALFFLAYQEDSTTVSALAKGLGVSSPRASRIADDLVRAGFVTRERSEQDRRELELRLSVTAKEFNRRIWDSRKVAIKQTLEQFKQTEIDIVQRFLQVLAGKYFENAGEILDSE